MHSESGILELSKLFKVVIGDTRKPKSFSTQTQASGETTVELYLPEARSFVPAPNWRLIRI